MDEKTKRDSLDLLADFCGQTKSLSEPFCENGYTYASDGKVIVRLPSEEITKNKDCFYDMSSLLFEQKGKLVSLPELPKETKATCDICGGCGKMTGCSECEGGQWECRKCNSTGYFKDGKLICHECNGSGMVVSNFQKTITINGHKLQLGYLRKLSKLPEIKIVAHPVKYQHYFKFDGGDGILMGVR